MSRGGTVRALADEDFEGWKPTCFGDVGEEMGRRLFTEKKGERCALVRKKRGMVGTKLARAIERGV